MKILVTCNIKGGRRQTRRCTLVRDMGEPARIIPSIFQCFIPRSLQMWFFVEE